MAARIDNGDEDGSELHEINVTPFIDVMLVLLIIFMVAAPLSTVDVAVDLPVSTAKAQQRPDKPLFLTIKADLSLAIGNDPIPKGQLAQAIDAATETDRQKRIFLRADKSVPYGELMVVMNQLRAGGYLKLALVGLESVDGSPVPPAGDAVPVPGPPSPALAAQPPSPAGQPQRP
jgi:biopolymer transport protein ExbD